MALPHYNLDTSETAQQLQQSAFPVILVPAEAPQKTRRVRQFLRSRRWLTFLAIIAVVAIAVMLWMVLDPNHKVFDPKQLVWPAAALGSCCLFFLLALLASKEPKEKAEEPPTFERLEVEEPPTIKRKEAEVLSYLSAPALPAAEAAPRIEFCFEQWTSEPFTEIMDEALLAEVFDDEMVAPDHMVFSVKVDE